MTNKTIHRKEKVQTAIIHEDVDPKVPTVLSY